MAQAKIAIDLTLRHVVMSPIDFRLNQATHKKNSFPKCEMHEFIALFLCDASWLSDELSCETFWQPNEMGAYNT